jgi:hypothetical protein
MWDSSFSKYHISLQLYILTDSCITNFIRKHALRYEGDDVFNLPGISNAGYFSDELPPLQMVFVPFLETYWLLGPHQGPWDLLSYHG